MKAKMRVLFFAEPASLAHVTRPVVLANTLDPARYEVCIATGPDFKSVAVDAGFAVRDLWSIGSHAFLAAVSIGRVVFSYEVLKRYVLEDLRHIEAFRPDILVGDFRLSLAVSARLSKIPYIGISNAYWSPFVPVHYEIPVDPTTRLFGPAAANHVFRLLRPLIFAQHSLPMHRLFRRYGMASLGFDLRRVFTEADVSAFADVPEMIPTKDCGIPHRYAYIGPVVWSPKVKIPSGLFNESDPRPLVYVTMGSSGDSRLLDKIIRAMVTLDYRVAVAVFGGMIDTAFPDHVVTADLLPGNEVAARAQLVICNGGSPSTHQALQQGVPVLGIAANLDQLLNMSFLVAANAGLMVRADQVSHDRIRKAAQRILKESEFAENARRIAGWFRNCAPSERFPALIEATLQDYR